MSSSVGDGPRADNRCDVGTLCGADHIRVHHFHEVAGLGVGATPFLRAGEHGLIASLWTGCEFVAILATIAIVCSLVTLMVSSGNVGGVWCNGGHALGHGAEQEESIMPQDLSVPAFE